MNPVNRHYFFHAKFRFPKNRYKFFSVVSYER